MTVAFALAAFFSALLIWALASGHMPARFGGYDRSANPGVYWAGAALYFVAAAYFLFRGLTAAI
jgi:hypothetical protein